MVHSSAAKISRNASLIFLATFLRMVMSFVFVIYAAGQLGVEGFGRYGLVTHYFELLLSLSATALGIFMVRESARRPDRMAELLCHSAVLLAGLLVVAAILLLAIFRLAGYSDQVFAAMNMAIVALVPAALASLLEAALVSLERAQHITVGTVVEGLIRYGLGTAILFAGGSLVSVFVALVVARCALLVYYVFVVRRLIGLQWQFHWGRYRLMVRKWRVFAAENWMATLYTGLDVIVLSLFYSEIAVGLYAAAGKIVQLGSIAARSYTTAVFPVLSRLHATSSSRFDLLNQVTLRFMVATTIPAAAALTLLSQQVIELLYSPDFLAAVPVLRILAWVLILECLNPFLSHTLFARGAQHRSMQVAAVALLANLAFAFTLTPLLGILGAAISTVAGRLAATCCYCRFSLTRQEISAVLRDVAKVAVATAGLVVAVSSLDESAWIAGLALGCVSYLALLIALRVVTAGDLRLLKSEF